MKEVIFNVIIGLSVLYFIIVPTILIMKIKYYKTLRGKEYNGINELFSLFSSEWWIAGFTLGFPIFGRDEDLKLNTIRKKANRRLYIFYLVVITQLALLGLWLKFDSL